jgi:hypothetical protein
MATRGRDRPPLGGVPVTFTIAPNAASGTPITAVTDSRGLAIVPLADRNMGRVTVIASVARGQQTPLSITFDPQSVLFNLSLECVKRASP